MIIDPQKIAERGILEGGRVAQNGIDCSLYKMLHILKGGTLGNATDPVARVAMEPLDGRYDLIKGWCYEFECREVVKVPAGMCAMLVGRSSLNRRGCNVFSGLYDSGFHGRIGGTIRPAVDIKIPMDAYILQIVFVASEGTAMYDGQYQHDGLKDRVPPRTEPKKGSVVPGMTTDEAAKGLQQATNILNKRGEGKKLDGEKARYDLIDPIMLDEVASVLTHGAKKYGDDNWKKGIKISRMFAACMRHMWAVLRGEDIDPESGKLHTAHAICNIMMMSWLFKNKPDMDDREVALITPISTGETK